MPRSSVWKRVEDWKVADLLVIVGFSAALDAALGLQSLELACRDEYYARYMIRVVAGLTLIPGPHPEPRLSLVRGLSWKHRVGQG